MRQLSTSTCHNIYPSAVPNGTSGTILPFVFKPQELIDNPRTSRPAEDYTSPTKTQEGSMLTWELIESITNNIEKNARCVISRKLRENSNPAITAAILAQGVIDGIDEFRRQLQCHREAQGRVEAEGERNHANRMERQRQRYVQRSA